MASNDKRTAAQEAVLDAITKKVTDADGSPSPASCTAILNLAEAYAWLMSQMQPHGGGRIAAKE